MINILILEDEERSRRFIKKIIAENLSKYGVFDTAKGNEAIDFAREFQPDIALLDIELDEGEALSGLDIAKIIHNISPKTKFVFITGYTKYAVDCYSVHPYDYILKPVNTKRVIKTLRALEDEIQKDNDVNSDENKAEKLTIKTKNKQIIIAVEDILFIERRERNTYIHSEQDIYKIEKTLKQLLEELPNYFLRVHKSYIVNKNKINKIISVGDRTYDIEFIETDKVARMSRNEYKKMKDILL